MLENNSNFDTKIRKKSCKRCGILFDFYGIGKMYCSSCMKIDTEQFQRVKDYLREVGPKTMFEIEAALGIHHRTVQVYLREGRLEVPINSEVFIHCEMCGAALRSGRYCPDCVHKLSSEFVTGTTFDSNEVGEISKQKDTGKIHYLSSDKKRS